MAPLGFLGGADLIICEGKILGGGGGGGDSWAGVGNFVVGNVVMCRFCHGLHPTHPRSPFKALKKQQWLKWQHVSVTATKTRRTVR